MDGSGQESKVLPQGARLPVMSNFGKKQTSEQNASARARDSKGTRRKGNVLVFGSLVYLQPRSTHTLYLRHNTITGKKKEEKKPACMAQFFPFHSASY